MRTYKVKELEEKHNLKYVDNRVLTFDQAFDLRNINFVLFADKYVTNRLTEYAVFVRNY